MCNRDEIYQKYPSLKKSENDILVLLCHCIGEHSVRQAVCEYMASEEGRSFRQRISRNIFDIREPEQVILILCGLVAHEMLLPGVPDEVQEPIRRGYLWDYSWLLAGGDLRNRRAVWVQMILSINRVAHERVSAEIYQLLNHEIVPLMLHWCDPFSDEYWRQRLDANLDHAEALAKCDAMLESRLLGSPERSDWNEEDAGDWVLLVLEAGSD
jgi:hypothetical protein